MPLGIYLHTNFSFNMLFSLKGLVKQEYNIPMPFMLSLPCIVVGPIP